MVLKESYLHRQCHRRGRGCGSSKAGFPGHGGHIGKQRVPVQGDCHDWGPPGKGWRIRVLGLRWDTEEGEICVDVKLNYGEKVKGAYTEEDASLTDPKSALPRWVTRRILWRVAQGQYDPLGFLSVYMVKWKQLMRKVILKGKGGRWESALDQEEEEEFRGLLQDLNELRKIRFPRCLQPLEGQFKKPLLLVFGGGSQGLAARWCN